MKADPEFVTKLSELIEKYRREVEEAPLTDESKRTYILHSTNFVNWVSDNFEPGGRNKDKNT